MEQTTCAESRIRELEAEVVKRDALLQRMAIVPVRSGAVGGLADRLHRGLDRAIRIGRRISQRLSRMRSAVLPAGSRGRDLWEERLDIAADLIAGRTMSGSGLSRFVAAASLPNARGAAWLGLVAALGRYPMPDELERAERALRHGVNSLAVMMVSLHESSPARSRTAGLRPLPGRVLIDVTNTSRTDLHTGIQRVVKEVASRWLTDGRSVAVIWDPSRQVLLELASSEAERIKSWADHLPTQTGSVEDVRSPAAAQDDIVVPFGATFVLPETTDDVRRAGCYRAMALGADPKRLGIIGYDLVPITAVETVVVEQAGHFSAYLSFLKQCSHLSAISDTAAREFTAFCTALESQGLPGPAVAAHPLPPTPHQLTPTVIERVRADLALPTDAPVILVVGSREPRKNHLAVLWAAEQLWNEGRGFQLVMVGGSAWNDDDVRCEIKRLQALGHDLLTRSRATEEELFSLYHLARFTVFPSLYEGFGLPVVESLAAGTPVVTSNYGAMAEVAAGGGALLADPRDWTSVLDQMRRALSDDNLLDSLRAEAHGRQFRNWSSHAAEVWQHLVGDDFQPAADVQPIV